MLHLTMLQYMERIVQYFNKENNLLTRKSISNLTLLSCPSFCNRSQGTEQ